MRQAIYRRMLESMARPEVTDKLLSILSQDVRDEHKEYKAICITLNDTAKKSRRYRNE